MQAVHRLSSRLHNSTKNIFNWRSFSTTNMAPIKVQCYESLLKNRNRKSLLSLRSAMLFPVWTYLKEHRTKRSILPKSASLANTSFLAFRAHLLLVAPKLIFLVTSQVLTISKPRALKTSFVSLSTTLSSWLLGEQIR